MNQMLTHKVQTKSNKWLFGTRCTTKLVRLGSHQTGAQSSHMCVLFNLNEVVRDCVYSLTLQKLASSAIRLSLKESVKCEEKAISCWCNQLCASPFSTSPCCCLEAAMQRNLELHKYIVKLISQYQPTQCLYHSNHS